MYNNEHQTYGQGGFITGLLCGAAVGAALGVVLAPRSGAATRQQLAESGGRLREKMSQGYAKASDGVSAMMARGTKAVEQGREAFEQTRPTTTDESGFGSLGPDYPSSRGI
jgi:gas vesicle protein